MHESPESHRSAERQAAFQPRPSARSVKADNPSPDTGGNSLREQGRTPCRRQFRDAIPGAWIDAPTNLQGWSSRAMDHRPTPEHLDEVQREFRKLCQGKIPEHAIDDVTAMAIRGALREVALAEREGDFSSIQPSPAMWAEDLAAKDSFSDCVHFYAWMDGSISDADLSRAQKDWRERFTSELKKRFCLPTSTPTQATPAEDHRFREAPSMRWSHGDFDPQAYGDQSPEEEPIGSESEEPSEISVYSPPDKSPAVTPGSRLDATDFKAVCEEVLTNFLNPAHLIPFLREGAPTVQPEDILDAAGILARLTDASSASRYLNERANKLIPVQPVETEGFPALRRAGNNPALRECLHRLNALIDDEEIWPTYWFESGLLSPQTIAAEGNARSDRRSARRYRRMVLNEVFAGRLSPRLGYSPRIGTLATFILPALFNRFRDARDKKLNDRRPKRAPVSSQPVRPGVLTPKVVPDPPALLRAIQNARHPAQHRWAKALIALHAHSASSHPGPEASSGKPAATDTEVLATLNQLMTEGPVFNANDQDDPSLPIKLRALCCAWRRFEIALEREETPSQSQAELTIAFNHRALSLTFPRLVRSSVYDDAIPFATPAPKASRELLAHGVLEGILKEPFSTVYLDLTLATKIPPAVYGRATRDHLRTGAAEVPLETPSNALNALIGILSSEHRFLDEDLLWTRSEIQRLKELVVLQESAFKKSEAPARKLPPPVLREFLFLLAGSNPKLLIPETRQGVMTKIKTLARRTSERAVKAALEAHTDADKEAREVLFQFARDLRQLGLTENARNRHEASLDLFDSNKPPWTRSQFDVGLLLGCDQSVISRKYAVTLAQYKGQMDRLVNSFVYHRLAQSSSRAD